jgi:hypothetical protein
MDPTQPDSSTLAFDPENLHLDNIPDLQNGARRNLRAVQQAILLDAKVNESAKVHNIAHSPFELHASYKIFYFQDIGA